MPTRFISCSITDQVDVCVVSISFSMFLLILKLDLLLSMCFVFVCSLYKKYKTWWFHWQPLVSLCIHIGLEHWRARLFSLFGVSNTKTTLQWYLKVFIAASGISALQKMKASQMVREKDRNTRTWFSFLILNPIQL